MRHCERGHFAGMLIVGKIPEDDAFVIQLVCDPLHASIKERFATSGGVKTAVAGVVSTGSGAGPAEVAPGVE